MTNELKNEGKKKFTVTIGHTAYYTKTIFAKNEAEAEEIGDADWCGYYDNSNGIDIPSELWEDTQNGDGLGVVDVEEEQQEEQNNDKRR